MITIELPHTKRRLYLPENLGECTDQQYAEACYLIYKYQHGLLEYPDFRVEMIYKLLNLKKGKGKLVKSEVEDMDSNIYMLSKFIDSFFNQDEEGRRVIKMDYLHNHSRTIRDAFRKWYGPADGFDDVSFGQYLDALNIFGLLEKEITHELLFRLMAIFYTQKNLITRKIEKYNPEKAKENYKHFRHVYFGRVYGFFLFFASFQRYLTSAKVYYEGKELDLSILFSGDVKEKSDIPGIGMLSIGFQLSESGVYGPYQELRERNMWEVLIRIYDIRKRDLDYEAQKKTKKE